MIESLEQRMMLSATLRGGILNVSGTRVADAITFTPGTGTLTVTINGQSQVFATLVQRGNTQVSAINRVIVHGQGGNDSIDASGLIVNNSPITAWLYGDAGDDTISGSAGADRIYGGQGNDNLNPGLRGVTSGFVNIGGDLLSGDAGNDLFLGMLLPDNILPPAAITYMGGGGDDAFIASTGKGADRFYGGGGLDTANYARRSDNLILSATGRATPVNTGSTEQDTIGRDVEVLIGGTGNDLIIGAGRGIVAGGAGDDSLFGGVGPDLILGGPGNDQIHVRDNFRDTVDGGDALAGDTAEIDMLDLTFNTSYNVGWLSRWRR
ncbi:MAG: LEPR-XLL domain-containing protein [Phycisphaerales bacterium]|jgi:Ca2+-binding RTX toxin-like protein|nr:LEPR-XLL domain-containing protein [Phycisphaerales bacterium]